MFFINEQEADCFVCRFEALKYCVWNLAVLQKKS
jgi:hypothetical protein